MQGIFGLATITFKSSITCEYSFCIQFCELDNGCTCWPGYTGTYCSNEIDDCVGVACNNSNTKCIDQLESYKCSCLPGFTGANCQNDLNECTVGPERCNFHGVCVNGVGSFHCECQTGYTGLFCDKRIEKFSVDATFHSVHNPGGKCADIGSPCSNGSGCCDHYHCLETTCDYMFLICWRELGSPVSQWRTERRGQCNYLETLSRKSLTEDHFGSSVYGTSNPIRLFTDVIVSQYYASI